MSEPPDPSPAPARPSALPFRTALGVSVACAAAGFCLGLCTGPMGFDGKVVLAALVDFDPSDPAHLAVRTLRLPRAVLGVVAGAAFALSGCVLQAITRNALAAPALVGIQPGASLAIVLGLTLYPGSSTAAISLAALAGAAAGAGLTFALARIACPARPGLGLLLAGLAVGLTTTGVVQCLVLSQSLSRDLLMWQTGTLVHAQWDVLAVMAPFWGVGFVLTFALARPLRTLALGDEAAVSLGADPGRVRALATLCVLLLAGTTVAVTGPVSFLGLLVPHAVRGIVGLDERRVLPLAAILGGGALVLADAASRLLRAPRETPVGVLLVAVGALFFLFQLRRGSGARFRLAADA